MRYLPQAPVCKLPGQVKNLTQGFNRHPLRKYLSFNFAPAITAHIARNVQIIIKQPNSILGPPRAKIAGYINHIRIIKAYYLSGATPKLAGLYFQAISI
jgi:hypothetical protein